MSYTKMVVPALPPGYTLVETCAPAADFSRLRCIGTPIGINEAQAQATIDTTFFGCHITYRDPSLPASSDATPAEVIAMGRVFGGGWYYHVADIVTLPAHQRRGLGDLIFKRLMLEVETKAPEGPTLVTLLADAPGRKMYERNGFQDGMPIVMGMRKIMQLPGDAERVGEE